MSKILFADTAGHRMQKLYGQSHFALTGLVPVSILAEQGSFLAKGADVALSFAIPFHSQVALNYGETLFVDDAAQS